MKDRLLGIWEKIKSFFDAMGRTTKIFVGLAVLLLVLGGFAIWFAQRNQPYGVVFYDLAAPDIQTVSTWLSDNGITDYKIEGSNVLVPEPLVDQTRAALYMQGYPSSGSAYERYSSMVSATSTDGDKALFYTYDLQDRLAGTIRQFDKVQYATVNIVVGEDRRYVLDSSNMTQATASVHLQMEGNTGVSNNVANAIRLAVSHSVADLDFANVVITDNLGNSYTDANDADGSGNVSEASYLKLQLQEQVNNRIRTELMLGLTAIYGADNVRVSVNSTIDIDQKVETSTMYPYPEDWFGEDGNADGRGIIGQETWYNYVTGPDGTTIGGIVGANPNSDIPMYPVDTDGDGVMDTFGGSSGDIDYQNNEVVTQTHYLAATVSDVQVGVTVNSLVMPEDAFTTDDLVRYIAVTAGINTEIYEDKVSVLIAPFPVVDGLDDEGKLETWMIFAIVAGLALFIILIIVFVILKRKKKREEEEAALQLQLEEEERLERERQEAEALALLEVPPPTDGADIMDMNTEKSMELRKDLRTFVGNNPEIAASLLRNLMKGGEASAPES